MFFQRALKGQNSLTSYIITIVLVFMAYFIGQLPLGIAIFIAIETNDAVTPDALEDFFKNPDFSTVGIDSNVGFFLLILMFVCAMIVLLLLLKYVHKKSLMGMITIKTSVDWSKIFFAFGLWIVLGAIVEVIFYLMNPEHYTFYFNPSSFIVLFLISFLILPIQTSFEEIFFRSYLMRGFGLAFKNKWFPLVLTSLLFASIHGLNPEIEKFGFVPMMLYYLTAGLVLGIMTIMDDSLELALGVHAAVNIYGALFVGFEGSAIQTDALWHTDFVDPWLMLLGLIAISFIFLYTVSVKYRWPSFRRLFQEIDFRRYI